MTRRLFRLPWRNASQISADFEDELAFHYDMRVAELVQRGASRDDAKAAAARESGDLDDARRYVRATDGAADAAAQRRETMHTLAQQISQVSRRLRRAPVFTATAVLTLALGIGACTLMFSIADTMLFEPLPFARPDRVVMIWGHQPEIDLGYPELPLHGRVFSAFRDNTTAFETITAFRAHAFNLRGTTAPERLDGIEATGDFFASIGVSPQVGRFFARENETPGQDRVAVISDVVWRRTFNADLSIVGRTISLNDEPYTVIGVAPRGFAFPRGAEMPGSFQFSERADVWVPFAPPRRGPSDLALVGRLRRGVTLQAARGDLNRVQDIQTKIDARMRGAFGTMVVPLRDQLVGSVRPMLLSLLAAVGLLLAIACVNTAQLQLAQLQSRRVELAVRAALGASARRLAAELIVEISLIAAVGGSLGMLAAWGGTHLARVFASGRLPMLESVSFNVPTALLAIGATLFAACVATAFPALLTARIPLVESLRRGRGAGGRAPSVRVRRALIAGELALSVVLVVCAGLLVRSLARQLAGNTGFSPVHGLTFEVTLPAARYPEKQLPTSMEHPAGVALFGEALEQLRGIPGVEAAAIGKPLPLSGAQEASVFVAENSPPLRSGDSPPIAEYTVASSQMFRALGTALVAGRDFTDDDRLESPPVAIVNEAMAKRWWPAQSAVGKRIKLGGLQSPAPWMTVVGVSADMKRYSLVETPRPEMIVPYTQNPYPTFATMQFVVRSARPVSTLLPDIRSALGKADALIPVSRVRSIEELISETSTNARFATWFMAAFGGAALGLAMIGLYGVIAFSVHLRRQEFGVRRALGATPREIASLVVGEGLRLVLAGVVIGAFLAALAGRGLRAMLYEVPPLDGAAFAAAILLLGGSAVVACLAPAWRAASVEPRAALWED